MQLDPSQGRSSLPGVSLALARQGLRNPIAPALPLSLSSQDASHCSSPTAYAQPGPAARMSRPSIAGCLATQNVAPLMRRLGEMQKPGPRPRPPGIRICISVPPPGDSYAWSSLRSTAVAHSYSSFKTQLWSHFLQEVLLTLPIPRGSCLRGAVTTLCSRLDHGLCQSSVTWAETRQTFAKRMNEDLGWVSGLDFVHISSIYQGLQR